MSHPSHSLANTLRFVGWSCFVEHGMLRSTSLFHKNYLAKMQKSGRWGPYQRGENGPEGWAKDGFKSLVVEFASPETVPGSSRFFYHPFWDLIDFQRLQTSAELRAASLNLDSKLWHLFVRHNETEQGDQVPEVFWYSAPIQELKLLELKGNHNLDGLAALLICARMSHYSQLMLHYHLFYSACLDIMKNHLTGQLFAEDRMKSWRLVIEACLLDQLHWMSLPNEVFTDKEAKALCDTSPLLHDWGDRAASHKHQLFVHAKPEARAFIEMVRRAAPPKPNASVSSKSWPPNLNEIEL